MQNPSHQYTIPGTYPVSLTVTGPVGSATETKVDYITVSVIVADFSGSPQTGEAPLTVNFTDLSSGDITITSWAWSFGDGGTSTMQNPSYEYTTPGTYTVSLMVSGPDGSVSETKVNYITVEPSPDELLIYFPLVYND
jgi:PKD repeat protein